MVKRKIVNIDQEKCDGCGLCVPACDEGAIQIIDGKAKLVDERYCDGLGDCLGECPQDAITIEEREAAEFDESLVEAVQQGNGGCPGMQMKSNLNHGDRKKKKGRAAAEGVSSADLNLSINSQLDQWPVQLMLVPENAPYFSRADLLICADCVPFAYGNFQLDLLKNRVVLVGCPKLDNNDFYAEKLQRIFSGNDINSVTVAFMEVPCCSGLVRSVERALKESGGEIPLEKVRIGIEGEKENL